jgi:hypothetical protein
MTAGRAVDAADDSVNEREMAEPSRTLIGWRFFVVWFVGAFVVMPPIRAYLEANLPASTMELLNAIGWFALVAILVWIAFSRRAEIVRTVRYWRDQL